MKHIFYMWFLPVLAIFGANTDWAATPTSLRPITMESLAVRAHAPYGKTPPLFEVNQGQSSKQVKFVSRGAGHTLFLTPTEAVLALNKAFGMSNEKNIKALGKRNVKSEAVRMKLLGANPNPRVVGEDELPGKVNYFIGNDPKKWRTNIATYKKVRYKSVYPGVDLVYYGNQKQLEYDLVVAPGANPKAIRLNFTGAKHMDVNKHGELVLDLSSGDIRWQLPVVYQNIGGARKMIAGNYVIQDNQQVGFQVASYDHKKPLVIDPVLIYSTYLGGSGSGNEWGNDIAVDSSGSAYVAGLTSSVDFPVQSPLQTSLKGSLNAFVTKFTPDGTALVYSTYLGGSEADYANSIAVDAGGNAYITGGTTSSDFPLKNPFQPINHAPSPAENAFVSKLNASGSALVYSTYLGGSTFDNGNGIAVDSKGYAYVAGVTSSTDFPTQHPFQATMHGIDANGFISKLNADGTALSYSTYLGGSGNGGDGVQNIAIDDSGDAYLTGTTNSTDFPLKNPLQGLYGGDSDAFVTKLAPVGDTLVYSTYIGGSQIDVGGAIAVDSSGNAYVTGYTTSTNFPTQNSLQSTFGGGMLEGDAFVLKMNSSGSALVYSTYLGGSSDDSASGIAVDTSGNAWVAGETWSTNFPTQNPIQQTNNGGSDAFISEFDVSGVLAFSTYLGGSGSGLDNRAYAIAIDSAGSAYVTGATHSSNFPVVHPFQATSHGGDDVFIAKLGDPTGAPTGLIATAGDTQVVLSWTALPGAASYNVKRSTVSGGPYATIFSPTVASYTDTGLTNGHTYYYVVSAVNGAGESANSGEASAMPKPPIPAVPTGLTITAGNTQVSLTWTASPGATSYHVKRSTTNGGPYTTISSPATNSATNTGLVNGTTYYYVVSAVNAAGESANSTEASATPKLPIPAAPTGLTATPGYANI